MTDAPREAALWTLCSSASSPMIRRRRHDSLQPPFTKISVVLSLQNGVDNEEKISASFRTPSVWRGSICLNTPSLPGEITEKGGFQRIVFDRWMADRPKRSGNSSLVSQRRIKCDLRERYSTISGTSLCSYLYGSFTAMSRLTQGRSLHSQKPSRWFSTRCTRLRRSPGSEVSTSSL